MEFGAFTSRGASFETILRSHSFRVKVVPGGKLVRLTRELCGMIDQFEPIWRQFNHIHPMIAYVGAGIPDITEKREYQNWRGKYQEVIMDWKDSDYDRLQAEYRVTEMTLKGKGVIPIFATIPPMDIKNWNEHRNTPQGRWGKRGTDYLLFQSEYQRMQHKQVEVITRMNNFIRELNRQNDALDLDLAKFVMIPREGCQNRPTRYRVNTGHAKLVDGCHPTPSLAKQWSVHAALISGENRERLSSQEALRIMSLPQDKYDMLGVPLEKSTLKLNFSDYE